MFSKSKSRPHASTRVHANTIKAAALFGATTAALLAFAAVVITTKAPPTDKQHCVVGHVPERSHFVLIDLTDRESLTPAQLHRVRSEILQTSVALRDGDRMEIVVLAAQQAQAPAKPTTVFAGCRPRSADGVGLDRGRRVLERDLHAGWTQPIQASLDSIQQRMGVPASTSPLLVALKELATRAAGRNRSLVFVSDLLESGETISAYKAGSVDFRKLQEARFDAVQIQGLLKDFDVHVFEVIDAKHPQRQAQARKFWADYFIAAQAKAEFSRF
jgi:hypothetical protein